jgi:hypothetical protein
MLFRKVRAVCSGNHPKHMNTFIHHAVCLTTGPHPLPKRVLHRVRPSASFFKFQHALVFFQFSSSSCLSLLPYLPFTSIPPSIFPLKMCYRRQFLCKMWPTKLVFLLFTVQVCMIFLSSSTLCNTSSFLTWSVHPFPAPHFRIFQVFLIYF